MPSLPDTFDLPKLRRPGSFPPGHQGPRRVRGVPNRHTRELRAAIIDAAAAHGGDGHGSGGLTGYLLFLASNHQRAFTGLLGKLLPLQIDGAIDSAVVAAVKVMTIPAGSYMSAENIAHLRQPVTIEDDQAEPGHSLTKDDTRTDR